MALRALLQKSSGHISIIRLTRRYSPAISAPGDHEMIAVTDVVLDNDGSGTCRWEHPQVDFYMTRYDRESQVRKGRHGNLKDPSSKAASCQAMLMDMCHSLRPRNNSETHWRCVVYHATYALLLLDVAVYHSAQAVGHEIVSGIHDRRRPTIL
jgi:hypothetical protein